MACIRALSRPSASNTTASELPAKRVAVKTSSVTKWSFIVLIRRLRRRISLRCFLHQRQCVAIGIAEERHPQIVIVHLGDQMWRAVEGKPALFQFGDRKRDIGAAKVDAAALGACHVAGFFQEQPDAGTIEKCQVAEPIKLPQAEDLPVK